MVAGLGVEGEFCGRGVVGDGGGCVCELGVVVGYLGGGWEGWEGVESVDCSGGMCSTVGGCLVLKH